MSKSRAREAIFLYGLATEDFGLEVAIPRIWSDSSGGISAAKRIGPSAKLRHLDVCEFYVQGAVQAGKLQMRKVKGTKNPANFLTKHPKAGPEVWSALPALGIADANRIAGATTAERAAIKAIPTNPTSRWKPELARLDKIPACWRTYREEVPRAMRPTMPHAVSPAALFHARAG